ncbi:MAG: hypothetical protein VX255_12470, partial [Candidatus Latescibacterota bacterium]|nr:hypothetical protein [Candidatus Latescibacterota bacterium]
TRTHLLETPEVFPSGDVPCGIPWGPRQPGWDLSHGIEQRGIMSMQEGRRAGPLADVGLFVLRVGRR